MQGLKFLSGRLEKRRDYNRALAKENKFKEIRSEAYKILKSGDPEALEVFMGSSADAQKAVESIMAGQDKVATRNIVNASKDILLGDAEPVETLTSYARKTMEEGGDAKSIIETARDVAGAKSNEEKQQKIDKMRKKAEMSWMIADPKGYKEYKTVKDSKAKTKTGKSLKLEQLINKRNETAEGSPDRDIYEQAIKKEIASAGQAKERPFMSKLMADGYMPGSRITGPMLDAFEAAASAADKMGNPLTVDRLKQMEFDAVKNRKTGSTAGGRLVISRAQNIESGQELLKEMKHTSKKLNFSNIKWKGSLEKWKKGKLNDPVFAEYMTQRADALFVITAAMKMNGVTDKAIEVEEEAFPIESSPRAFNAWYKTQMRALNRAGKLMNRDFGFGIKLQPTGEEEPKQETASQYKEGQTATGPNGQKAIFRGGKWEAM